MRLLTLPSSISKLSPQVRYLAKIGLQNPEPNNLTRNFAPPGFAPHTMILGRDASKPFSAQPQFHGIRSVRAASSVCSRRTFNQTHRFDLSSHRLPILDPNRPPCISNVRPDAIWW